MPLLSIRTLGLRWPDGTEALRGLDLEVQAGELVAVLGRSGAGKSTLLRCVAGALRPTAGAVDFEGRSVASLRGAELRRHRRAVGMIFQQFHLVGRLTVLENVLSGRLGHRSSPATWLRRFPAEDRERAMAALTRVGLPDLAHRRADRLSGGQKQRTAIARALCQEPHVLLADEPIAALDPRSADEVMELLAELNAQDGLTVLANLHHVDAARRFARRAVGIRAGRLVFDGPADALDEAAIGRIYDGPAEEAA